MKRRHSGRTSRLPGLLRRAWILPVSVVVVAALAYGAAGLKSTSYTAQSTIVVSSATSPIGQGAANAAAIAASYSSALPQDAALRQWVTRRVGPLHARSITAVSTQGSVVQLRFTANSAAVAQAGARAIAQGLTGPQPRSGIVQPGTLNVITDATAPAGNGLGSYHSDVLFTVPGNTGPLQGLNPDDADKLSATYAGIIPTDTRLLTTVGRAVGQDSSAVGSHLAVTNQQSTSLLNISFTSADPTQAQRGAVAAARALAGPKPVAAGIVPSSVQIVSLPRVPVTVAKSNRSALIIGAGLGLVLGLVLLIAWERSDPRVRDARELSSHIGSPATPVQQLTPTAARALLERWASLADRVPARVALLPASASVEAETGAVASTLRDAGGSLVRYVDGRAGLPDEDAVDADQGRNGSTGVVLTRTSAPGGENGGEAVALASDLAVVVVPAGARAADVRELAEELANFGIVPVWTLLTPPGYEGRPLRGRAADAVTA